jgi:hypothetical protein
MNICKVQDCNNKLNPGHMFKHCLYMINFSILLLSAHGSPSRSLPFIFYDWSLWLLTTVKVILYYSMKTGTCEEQEVSCVELLLIQHVHQHIFLSSDCESSLLFCLMFKDFRLISETQRGHKKEEAIAENVFTPHTPQLTSFHSFIHSFILYSSFLVKLLT